MLVTIAYADCRPDAVVALTELLRTLAEHTRTEEGNVEFSPLVDDTTPTRFVTVEKWVDQDALLAHFAMAHTQQFISAAEPLTVTPIEVVTYRGVA